MTDIIERLRHHVWDTSKLGFALEADALMKEAADTIERLRSLAGKADVGPSFAEVTKELRRVVPDA